VIFLFGDLSGVLGVRELFPSSLLYIILFIFFLSLSLCENGVGTPDTPDTPDKLVMECYPKRIWIID